MSANDINNYFEKMERSLKRLAISLVDDFEEIKRGNPAPTIALVRQLLFNTSTVVMKYMLLRGCPSHVNDKKVIISLYDLLRETVKYSPTISVDQFFNVGFAQHKLLIITKLADYVSHIDRQAGKSPTKTSFVVPSEILGGGPSALVGATGEGTRDYILSQLLYNTDDTNSNANPLMSPSLVGNKAGLSATSSAASVSSASVNGSRLKRASSTSRLRVSTASAASSSSLLTSPPPAAAQSSATQPSTAATTQPPLPPAPLAQPATTYIVKNIYDQQQPATSSPMQQPTTSSSAANPVSLASSSNTSANLASSSVAGKSAAVIMMSTTQLEELIDSRIKKAVSELVMEKYDFVINKLVAAVDAEFTLLNNRMKSLEQTVQGQVQLQQAQQQRQYQQQQRYGSSTAAADESAYLLDQTTTNADDGHYNNHAGATASLASLSMK